MKLVTACWTDRAQRTLPSIYSPLALSFSELDKITEIFSGINPQDHSNEKRCNAFTNPVGPRAELAASPSRAPYDISIFLGTRYSHASRSVPVDRFIRGRPHRGRGHKQIYTNLSLQRRTMVPIDFSVDFLQSSPIFGIFGIFGPPQNPLRLVYYF